MSLETAKVLLKSIVRYNQVKDGPSGNAEREAGRDLQTAATDHLLSEGQQSIELADMIVSFAISLNNPAVPA